MARQPRRRRLTRVARLTRRGWAVLAIGVLCLPGAYWLGRRELLYLGSFLALLVLVSLAFVWFRRMRLSVNRVFSPRVVAVGHPTVVDVEVRNLATSASAEASWRDSLPWSPFATVPSVLPALRAVGMRYGAGASLVKVRYSLQPRLRGVFEVGPMLIDFSDPFGLAEGAIVAGTGQPLIVPPDVAVLPDGAVSIAADEGPTRQAQRRSYGGEDDLMTREYRRGDALRRVHWRASAHHGELMVRQEEQRSHAEARILIDTRAAGYRDVDGQHGIDEPESATFEWAISMLASIGLHLQRSGFLVTVIETGRSSLAPIDHAEEFLESLASIGLDGGVYKEFSLLNGVQRPDHSQGSVFAILADAERPTVDRLVAQRHAFDLAVVFIASSFPATIAETLGNAGWVCVAVAPDQPIEDAWLAAGNAQAISSERGSPSVRG